MSDAFFFYIDTQSNIQFVATMTRGSLCLFSYSGKMIGNRSPNDHPQRSSCKIGMFVSGREAINGTTLIRHTHQSRWISRGSKRRPRLGGAAQKDRARVPGSGSDRSTPLTRSCAGVLHVIQNRRHSAGVT